jgi:WD40 repeat protein
MDQKALSCIRDYLKTKNLTKTLECLEQEVDFEPCNVKPLLLLLEEDEPQCSNDIFTSVPELHLKSSVCLSQHDKFVTCLTVSTIDNVLAVISGCSDKSVSVIDASSGSLMFKYVNSSPVLGVAASGNMIVCTCMDGSILFTDASLHTHQRYCHHKSYVYSACFSSNGEYLATCSRDNTIVIYQVSADILRIMKTLNYENLRCIRFIQNQLFIGTKSNLLRNVSVDANECIENKLRALNLNANNDNHVSFSPMHISVSSDFGYFAVYTDSKAGKVSVYNVNGDIVKEFYGLDVDDFSNPRSAWHHSGRFLACTSGSGISLFDLASDKRLQLLGHSDLVRDLFFEDNILYSCANDKTVRKWLLEEA